MCVFSCVCCLIYFFFFSSRRRHTRCSRDWSSDVCSSDLYYPGWWEGGTTNHTQVNLQKWNELPKNYQAILRAAAAYANTEETARYDARNPAALKRLVANGAQLRPFPQAVMEA